MVEAGLSATRFLQCSREGNTPLPRQQTGTGWRAPVCELQWIYNICSMQERMPPLLHHYLINYFRHRQWRFQQIANCVHRRSLSHFELSDTYTVSQEDKFGFLNICWNLNFLSEHHYHSVLWGRLAGFTTRAHVVGSLSEHVLHPQLSSTQQYFMCHNNGQCVTRCWPRL